MLDRNRCPPVAPDFEQIMGQAHETPFTTDVLQPAQQEATEPTRFFDLAKDWLDDDLASGVQRAPCRGAHFRCHALLRRGGCGARLGCRLVVLLAPRGYGGCKPPVLHRLPGSLPVLTINQA